MNPQIEIRSPEDCTSQDLQEFEELVKQGAEVISDGLSDRVRQAHLLGFCRFEGEIVAVAAVKCPNSRYRIKHCTL